MRALFAALSVALFAAPPLPAQTPSGDRVELARTILDQIEPDAQAVDLEMRGWEAGVRAALKSAPAMQALEADAPGTIEAGVAAGRAVAIRHLPRIVAQMKAKRVALIAERLTLDELREFQAFATSPVGLRYYESVQKNVAPEEMAAKVGNRAVETGDVTITEADAGKAIRRTLSGVHKQLSAADTIAILKFEQSRVGKKLAALVDEVVKMQLEIANNPDPDWMAEQDEAMTDAIIKFAEARIGSR